MKTLNNHLLFYDENCPFCVWYSNLFVKFGFIDAAVRVPFRQIKNFSHQINEPLAKNKIPLLNTETGKVNYGIDALIAIISNRIPVLKPLLNFQPVYIFNQFLYALISYNRKVIFPYKMCAISDKDDCQPSYNKGYRWLFVILSIPLISIIVQFYSQFLHELIHPISFWKDITLTLSMFIFQGLCLYIFNQNRKLEYLGNLAVISISGALLLLPLSLIGQIITLNYWVFFIYFLGVHAFMIGFHFHRTKLLNMDARLTLSLIVFRILLLVIVLNFLN